jgi:hypothetical protein
MQVVAVRACRPFEADDRRESPSSLALRGSNPLPRDGRPSGLRAQIWRAMTAEPQTLCASDLARLDRSWTFLPHSDFNSSGLDSRSGSPAPGFRRGRIHKKVVRTLQLCSVPFDFTTARMLLLPLRTQHGTDHPGVGGPTCAGAYRPSDRGRRWDGGVVDMFRAAAGVRSAVWDVGTSASARWPRGLTDRTTNTPPERQRHDHTGRRMTTSSGVYGQTAASRVTQNVANAPIAYRHRRRPQRLV